MQPQFQLLLVVADEAEAVLVRVQRNHTLVLGVGAPVDVEARLQPDGALWVAGVQPVLLLAVKVLETRRPVRCVPVQHKELFLHCL